VGFTTPRARTDELVLEELGGELLVYDLRTDAAHCLDAQAAAVWRACNGEATVSDIAAATGIPRDGVEHALRGLADRDLMDGAADHHSRREAVKLVLTVGAAGAAIPVIRSIVAPTAAQAGSVSCFPDGAGCSVDSDCCSQNCNSGVCGPPL
jgi:hypothetical protein